MMNIEKLECKILGNHPRDQWILIELNTKGNAVICAKQEYNNQVFFREIITGDLIPVADVKGWLCLATDNMIDIVNKSKVLTEI